MTHEVFISFKNSGRDGKPTPDAREARRVYEALKGVGLKVFFSEESLAEAGKGNFSKSIEAALDGARILVLVASCREHIESQWVEAEWDSFLQDVRSGNKQGEMFILNCGGLRPTDLPLFLRRQQMFPAADLDKLVKFIASAMPARVTVEDVVKVSLHCLRPEQNEDKVYMLAVHAGSAQGRHHVTAYWGARSAKRLSSQMKAINVTAQEAAAEVEKARQEKLRGGYRSKPMAKIITPEARAQVLASLGIADAPPPGRKPDRKAAPVRTSRSGAKETHVEQPSPERARAPKVVAQKVKKVDPKKPEPKKAVVKKVAAKTVASRKVVAKKVLGKASLRAPHQASPKAPRKAAK